MTRLMVTGSRSWTAREDIVTVFSQAKTKYGTDVTLVHGGARGVDRLAASVATELGWRTEAHIPDWDGLGKRAGFVRNEQMLDAQIHTVVAFWDGSSRGTKHAIDGAHARGIRTFVIHPRRSDHA